MARTPTDGGERDRHLAARYVALIVLVAATHVAAHLLVDDASSAWFWVVRVALLLPALLVLELLTQRGRREPADTRPGSERGDP